MTARFLSSATAEGEGRAAPGPYAWESVGARGRLGHVYIVDIHGRKIGVVWGPAEEKRRTAGLMGASWAMREALMIARTALINQRSSAVDPEFRDALAQIDEALAFAEDIP